jgi:hypothetical protein
VTFAIEPGDATDLGPCDCCGGRTRVVRGFVSNEGGARAVYLVRWAPGRPDHDAVVAVSIGRWSGASAAERTCFALALRVSPSPGFMLMDAGASPWGASEELLGRMTSRADALVSPLKQEVFDILDAVGEQDGRVNAWRLDGPNDPGGRPA